MSCERVGRGGQGIADRKRAQALRLRLNLRAWKESPRLVAWLTLSEGCVFPPGQFVVAHCSIEVGLRWRNRGCGIGCGLDCEIGCWISRIVCFLLWELIDEGLFGQKNNPQFVDKANTSWGFT